MESDDRWLRVTLESGKFILVGFKTVYRLKNGVI
ncbi:hypothetical protein SRDD_12620 [Serratia sp. DD3]|nr:hypothetical protein SRDD_12620 [Serratia sp. DD3]